MEPLDVWMPYTTGGSGSDVSTRHMAEGLRRAGHRVVEQRFAQAWQYAPRLLGRVAAPPGTQLPIVNSRSGFAFARPGIAMIAVERLFVHDPAARRFRSFAQGIFHDHIVHRQVALSCRAADAVVCMSEATLRQVRQAFPDLAPRLIVNAVDTEFFTPPPERKPLGGRAVRVLFVGNPTRRKGADLIPAIMAALAPGNVLHHTAGLRGGESPLAAVPGAVALGRLDGEGMRAAYGAADVLLLPSRLEGLPRAAMEAQACGLPAVVSDASALPETVTDGVTGHVCPAEAPAAYAAAIRAATADPAVHARMCVAARDRALAHHRLEDMIEAYLGLAREFLGK